MGGEGERGMKVMILTYEQKFSHKMRGMRGKSVVTHMHAQNKTNIIEVGGCPGDRRWGRWRVHVIGVPMFICR